MKSKLFPTLLAGLTTLSIAPARAIEAPADNAPPPAALGSPGAPRLAAHPAPDEAIKPKSAGAFLGVVSAEVPGMLAEHIGLKAGEGIVVQALMPDGPAAHAGVTVHDVITRAAGQPVSSALDLTRQVAAHQPGETIHLKIIHKGQPAEVEVTLGARPDNITAFAPSPLDQLNLNGLSKDLADRVRGAIEGNLGGMDLNSQDDAAAVAPQIQEAMREMKKRMQHSMEGMDAPGEPQIAVQQGATIRLMDEQGTIELKSNEGGKEVTIRDKENKIIWNGAWDTEQDKAAAPKDVRQRVERLNIDSKHQGKGLRLRFGGAGQPNE